MWHSRLTDLKMTTKFQTEEKQDPNQNKWNKTKIFIDLISIAQTRKVSPIEFGSTVFIIPLTLLWKKWHTFNYESDRCLIKPMYSKHYIFRFAHLINIDFFDDLYKVFNELIESEVCTCCGFKLLYFLEIIRIF